MIEILLGILACCAALATPASAQIPPPTTAPVAAFKAPLATKAPLLAIARAGSRLVAVGDYGVVVLSDDNGTTWRQANAVSRCRTPITMCA